VFANWPVFLSYVMSFVYVGIYWNNHHHLLHLVKRINGRVMWGNLNFLFWISLFPFTTAWLNESHGERGEFPAPVPTLVYGVVLLMTSLAWMPLMRSLIQANGGREGTLARALASGWKEKISPLIYLGAIVVAFFAPIVSCVLYAAVAVIWLVPDTRIENHVKANP